MSEEIRDVDDMFDEDSDDEKETPLKEDYEVKKATFKLNKPNIEQFFDKKKLLAVLGIIAVLTAVFIYMVTPKGKQDEKDKSDVSVTSQKPIDVVDETATNEIVENVPEGTEQAPIDPTQDPNAGVPSATGIPDTYDSQLGSQYNDNETFSPPETSTFSDDTQQTEEVKKSYKRSPISFKKKYEANNSNPAATMTPEQQLLMQQQMATGQQQNTGGNQIIDTSQNRQESKQKFVTTARSKSFYSTNTVVPALSRYEIKAGTMIPAVLLTGVNSDLPGEILAQVTRDVHDFRTLKHTLIPKGSRIIGRYDSNITYGQNRLLVVWDRIIFPNGNELALDNYQGVDVLGNSGLKGKVNNHFWKLLRSVILSAGINMATGALEDVNVNVNSSSRARVSIGAGTRDLSQNVEGIGSRLIEKDLNQQPTIQIKRGSRFNIFVNSNMVLPVYRQ